MTFIATNSLTQEKIKIICVCVKYILSKIYVFIYVFIKKLMILISIISIKYIILNV